MSRVPESGRFFVGGVPVLVNAVLLPLAGFHAHEAPEAAAVAGGRRAVRTTADGEPDEAAEQNGGGDERADYRRGTRRGCSTLLMTPSVRRTPYGGGQVQHANL